MPRARVLTGDWKSKQRLLPAARRRAEPCVSFTVRVFLWAPPVLKRVKDRHKGHKPPLFPLPNWWGRLLRKGKVRHETSISRIRRRRPAGDRSGAAFLIDSGPRQCHLMEPLRTGQDFGLAPGYGIGRTGARRHGANARLPAGDAAFRDP